MSNEYTFPKNSKFAWDFSSGTPKVQVLYDKSFATQQLKTLASLSEEEVKEEKNQSFKDALETLDSLIAKVEKSSTSFNIEKPLVTDIGFKVTSIWPDDEQEGYIYAGRIEGAMDLHYWGEDGKHWNDKELDLIPNENI